MILPDEISCAILYFIWCQSFHILVLFPLVWLLVACCRGRFPRWQHGFWLLIICRLLLPPDTAFTWSAGSLIRSALWVPRVSLTHSGFVKPGDAKPRDAKPGHSGDALTGPPPQLRGVSPEPDPPDRLAILTCTAWMACVLLLLVRFLRRRARFRRIARQGEPVSDQAVQGILAAWQERLHIRRAIRLRKVGNDAPSFTMGLFRPVIALPGRLLAPARRPALETVLAHELVHVKRNDDLWVCCQELVKICYFFHPIVWFVMPRLARTREAACDVTVLSHGTISPAAYGRQMLACLAGRNTGPVPSPALTGFSSAARDMAFRLNIIQKEAPMDTHWMKRYLVIGVLGLFLLPMATSASSDRDGAGLNPLARYVLDCVACENPEDVARIIRETGLNQPGRNQSGTDADDARLAAATDCDVVNDIGDGRKAYVFYLLAGSRRGVYRPNFHFVIQDNRLFFQFKSPNVCTYAKDRPKVNGRYEILEGWRADLFNGIRDDRVTLAWGSRVWFWTGDRYAPAYTDYTVEAATDPSLLGTDRKWVAENRTRYEAGRRD